MSVRCVSNSKPIIWCYAVNLNAALENAPPCTGLVPRSGTGSVSVPIWITLGTITGSVRGAIHSTPAARTAQSNQRTVPRFATKFGSVKPIPVGAGPCNTAGGRAAVRESPRSFVEAVRKAVVPADNVLVRAPSTNGGDHGGTSSTAPVAEDKKTVAPLAIPQAMEIDGIAHVAGEDENPDPIIAEETDCATLQRQQTKYERILLRRQGRHAKELALVEAQKQRISEHQAELVLLQAQADATHAKVLEFSATIARLASRAAELAAERARSLDAQPPLEGARGGDDGVLYARKCIGDMLAGVRKFGNELPEVQGLLVQLAAALDAARTPVRDQMRPTLPVVLAQAEASPSAGAQRFDINAAPSTPGPGRKEGSEIVPPVSARKTPASILLLSVSCHSSPIDAVDMQVVGECSGDKRKWPMGGNEDEDVASVRPPPVVIGTTAQHSQSSEVGQVETPTKFVSHDVLRKHLMAQSHRQAQLRKARALQAPRAAPY